LKKAYKGVPKIAYNSLTRDISERPKNILLKNVIYPTVLHQLAGRGIMFQMLI